MQEREIQRLGDTTVRKVNVRFLFATHKDLKRLVKEGAYREDLFYRISVYTIHLPALRERIEDIPLLLRHFVARYSHTFDKGEKAFSPAAVRMLCEYPWPGNVRELENIVQTVLVNCDSEQIIEPEALPAHLRDARFLRKVSGKSLEAAREEFEKDFLMDALMKFAWNKTHTARELKITRQGLINMIQRLGIQEPEK